MRREALPTTRSRRTSPKDRRTTSRPPGIGTAYDRLVHGSVPELKHRYSVAAAEYTLTR